jgi:tetratricopeptide (TPR) repeat protein
MRPSLTARFRVRSIAFGAVLLLFQSVAASQPTGATTVKPSKDWKRVRTRDLTVVGNASEQQLRTALKQIEDFRAGLVALFPGLRLTSRTPTTMVVLKDADAFRSFQPRDERGRRRENIIGYFTTTPEMNYMVLGAFGDRDATLEVIYHEYTHFILRQNFRSLPTWVNEGVADFYSTFRSNYKNGQSLVGTPPRGRLDGVRERPVKPLERILTNEGTAMLFRNPVDMAAFYAQAWAFIHYAQLGNDGKRRGQIGAYLRALDQGLPIARAFNEAFGVTFEQMQREIDAYVRRPAFAAVLFSPRTTTADIAGLPVEPLTESDASYVQAALLLNVGATEDAARLLTNALAIEPSHSDAKIGLARVRSEQGHRDEAIADLEAIAAAAPGAFAAHLYLAGMLRASRRYEDALRAADRAVALDRESTYALYELNLSAIALGRAKEADDAMAQIMRQDSDPSWYRTRTYDAYALGRDEVVVGSAAAYIGAAGAGNESSPYVAYAAALASMRLGRQTEAAALLKEVEDTVSLDSWQQFVAQYLAGQRSADKLLAKASSDGERTEAHAYVGALSAVQGRQEDALFHLRWVKDHGLKNYVEFRMAIADLERLERAKSAR